MFKKLSSILSGKFERKDNLSRQLEIVRVFDIYKEEIKKRFPDDRETRPIMLKNNILTVQTGSSVQASELRFSGEQIIDKINEEIGKAVISRIIYRF